MNYKLILIFIILVLSLYYKKERFQINTKETIGVQGWTVDAIDKIKNLNQAGQYWRGAPRYSTISLNKNYFESFYKIRIITLLFKKCYNSE